MQYEYWCWYEWVFSPKNTDTLKEWMDKYIWKTVKVQSWEDIIENGDYVWQQRLSLLEMLWEECCWIPEEDFVLLKKIESPVRKSSQLYKNIIPN